MTEEETRATMLEVASLASNAVNVAIGGLCDGFDPDPEMVEDLLSEALMKSLEEIDGPVGGSESRDQLLAALRRFRDEPATTGDNPDGR